VNADAEGGVSIKFAGHMIFRKQVLRANHADRIRRERTDAARCAAFPAINDLPA
jgi:hypothetical protein